jgi:hypothetical protein
MTGRGYETSAAVAGAAVGVGWRRWVWGGAGGCGVAAVGVGVGWRWKRWVAASEPQVRLMTGRGYETSAVCQGQWVGSGGESFDEKSREGARVGAGAPQVSFGPGEGCVDEPGPETRGARQCQWVGNGGHGLTEPEPEPKRAMIRRQRRLYPERWAAVMMEAAMVAWQGRSRHTPGQFWTRWGVCGRASVGAQVLYMIKIYGITAMMA